MGRLSRDEAKRLYRKEGKDIIGSKSMLKKLSKNKGKGKTGKPILERHGNGTEHWHTPDRTGGHGFIAGALTGLITLLDYIDPIALLSGELAGPEYDMLSSENQNDDSPCK